MCISSKAMPTKHTTTEHRLHVRNLSNTSGAPVPTCLKVAKNETSTIMSCTDRGAVLILEAKQSILVNVLEKKKKKKLLSSPLFWDVCTPHRSPACKAFIVRRNPVGSITAHNEIWQMPESCSDQEDLYIWHYDTRSRLCVCLTGPKRRRKIKGWVNVQKVRQTTTAPKISSERTSAGSRALVREEEDEMHESQTTHRFTLPQFLLSAVKVEVDVQALHKLGDRIFVSVGLLKSGRTKSVNFLTEVKMFQVSF